MKKQNFESQNAKNTWIHVGIIFLLMSGCYMIQGPRTHKKNVELLNELSKVAQSLLKFPSQESLAVKK